MNRAIPLLFLLGLATAPAADEWLLATEDGNGFWVHNHSVKAQWDDGQVTTYTHDSPSIDAKVGCHYYDSDYTYDYDIVLNFSGGTGQDHGVEVSTSGWTDSWSGYLLQRLSTGGDRYYKDTCLCIEAESDRNLGGGTNTDSDCITLRLIDSSWKIPTQTEIKKPKGSVYFRNDLVVKGQVRRKSDVVGGDTWYVMDPFKNVEVKMWYDGAWTTVTVQTNYSGEFTHTFSAPTLGWTPDASFTVTCTFKANQFDPYDTEPPTNDYSVEYKTSSDTESHTFKTNIDNHKAGWEAFKQHAGTVTIQNPADDDLPDGSTFAYDIDGTLRGIHSTMAPPPHGVVVIDEDTLDDDLTTLTGTLATENLVRGYQTYVMDGPGSAITSSPGTGSPGPTAFMQTLVFLPPGEKQMWEYTTGWGYDPPAPTADLTMRFYDMAGSLLHQQVVTVNAYERFEMPDSWLDYCTAVHAEIADGYLVGWAMGRLDDFDAYETLAQTSTCTRLCAPFMSGAPDHATTILLHNPSDYTVVMDINWYEVGGGHLYYESRPLIPKGSVSFDSFYLGPGLDKSIEVDVTAGPGVIGTCFHTSDTDRAMAEPMVGYANPLRVPSPGTPYLEDGELFLHNPDDVEPVTVEVTFYDISGAPVDYWLNTIGPHQTTRVPYLPPVKQPELPSAEIHVLDGPDIAVTAAFYSMMTGGCSSVPALPMPQMARCETPWLRTGWNLISVPLDPDDPEFESVLAALEKAGNTLAHSLYGYETGSGYTMYPETLTYVVKGDGYWLNLDAAAPFTVIGTIPTEDACVGLHQGWNLIGLPCVCEPHWWGTDCAATYDGSTLSIPDAAAAGWLQAIAYDYDGGYRAIGDAQDDAYMHPWHGYWVLSYVEGLILTFSP